MVQRDLIGSVLPVLAHMIWVVFFCCSINDIKNASLVSVSGWYKARFWFCKAAKLSRYYSI